MQPTQGTTRRSFLRGTAGLAGVALGAPLLVPASALGRGGQTAPSERITVGMIGTGRQCKYRNLPELLALPEVQIVAVCDVDAWRMGEAKKRIEDTYAKQREGAAYKGCATFVDFHELLARNDLDAVMISTPDHWHTPMALAAFEAGKDVSLEKPVTRTVAQGQALVKESARLKRIFRVDSELRSYPHIVRAAELVRNGRLGQLHTVTVGVPSEAKEMICPPQPEMPVPKDLDYGRWQGPAPRAPYTEHRVHAPRSYERPGWMRHLYYCDGMITNWTTHWNDGAMWLTGLETTGPVEIHGTGRYPPKDNFWNVLMDFDVHLRFANGLQWRYHSDKPFLKIEGSEGWIRVTYEKLEAGPASILDSEIKPDELHFQVKSDKQDFIDSVKSRKPTLEPAVVGHRVTSLGLLGQISIQLGQKLTWDPDQERFKNNDAANAYLDKPVHAPTYV